MKRYLWHLKQQTMHQLRGPCGLGKSLDALWWALVETILRALAPFLLPLAPLLAVLTLLDERKRQRDAARSEAAALRPAYEFPGINRARKKSARATEGK